MTPDTTTSTPDTAGRHARAGAGVVQLLVDCPRCGGRGEIEVRPYRNEWGVQDCERLDQCGICQGVGELTRADAAEYAAYVEEKRT